MAILRKVKGLLEDDRKALLLFDFKVLINRLLSCGQQEIGLIQNQLMDVSIIQ